MRVSIAVSSVLSGREVELQGFGADTERPSRLTFGGKAVDISSARLKRGKTGPRLAVSSAVGNAFNLPKECELHVNVLADRWQIGPVLGLYVDKVDKPLRPFGEQTRMFEEMTTYGQALGVYVVVLTPGDVTRNTASRFDAPMGTWTECANLHPNLVLRRSGTFSPGHTAQAEADLKLLQQQGKLHTLPRTSSNKWTLYQVLTQSAEFQDRLPKTMLCRNGRELYQFVRDRQDVYLKPPGGAQGVSIYHLRRNGNVVVASWERRMVPRKTERESDVFLPETRVLERTLATEAACIDFWREIKLKRAIVQDTVKLPRKDGSPYDFRWLVHSSDHPTVLARVARIGKPQAITTNIHTGGVAVPAETMVARTVGKDQSESVISQMDDVAKDVVRAFAHKYGPFAELGVDLALTEAGGIYIFEVNPTPGRRMLRELGEGTRRLSLESLLEYAIRATGHRS